jgi:hypothetical protein
LPDNEDDQLAQILTILEHMPRAQRPKYIAKLLEREDMSSKSSKIPLILRNRQLYSMLRSLVVMKHFRATKSGTGFTMRQLGSWMSSSCGASLAHSTLLWTRD